MHNLLSAFIEIIDFVAQQSGGAAFHTSFKQWLWD